ncbi:MAG: hypothetical protein EOP59_00630 [Sphingomonadales bacterium]|nr:MAG: hypothetical protein EOP59_00630 [Sphingomonadales bacterium]
MALIVTFLGLLAAMVFAADTPAGRFLHRALVALPARGLARISGGSVLAAVGVVATLAAVFWLIDEELAVVMTLMAPEALAYIAMFEIGTLIETLLAVTFISTTARFRQVVAMLRGLKPRARTPRTRRKQRPAPSNDDEEGAGRLAA